MHILPISAKELEEKLLNIPVNWEEITDQEYNPDSAYAQSGKAVAEALAALNTYYTGVLINQSNYKNASLVIDGPHTFKKNDLYINESENIIYKCIEASFDDNTSNTSWLIVNKTPDTYYATELDILSLFYGGVEA